MEKATATVKERLPLQSKSYFEEVSQCLINGAKWVSPI